MSDVSRLIEAAGRGDPQAGRELLPLVYDELRKLAAARLANEAAGQTLQPTALVHEAYLRLVGDEVWDGRGHFFAAAAEAMRRILVDNARRKKALKRGGEGRREPLTDLPAHDDDEVIELDGLVDRLAEVDPQAGELVKLRYFAGLTMKECATAMDVPLRSAERTWTYARAWLRREVETQNG